MLALSLIFDIAVGVIILISTLLGMSRGFMREVTSLVAILGAGLAASSFGMRVGDWVSTLLPAALQEATLLTLLGGLVVFLVTFFVLLLLFIPIWAGVQRSNYRGVDISRRAAGRIDPRPADLCDPLVGDYLGTLAGSG